MDTANDRLRERLSSIYAGGLIAAAIGHLLLFQLSPTWTVGDWGRDDTSTVEVIPTPDVAIPRAPEALARPALPVATADVDPTATIADVPFESVPDLPPPPPPASERSVSADPFVAYTIAPRLLDERSFLRELERVYPSSLRNSGIGGVVQLLIEIDEQGAVLGASIGESSGYARLDEAALSLAPGMRFSPAMNRDRAVPVRVSVPVTFQVRRDG